MIPMPASKTVCIYLKSGQKQIAVLPEHLQNNHDIGYWLENNVPNFDRWCYAPDDAMPEIRYDFETFAAENNISVHNMSAFHTVSDDDTPFLRQHSRQHHPNNNQTVIIDTVKSHMFWICAMANGKHRICCNHYIIHQNIILAPPIMTEDFDDAKSAWATMLEIKRRPHMAFMAIITPPSVRIFNQTTDTELLLLPALDHINHLEKQISDMKPALDAYKRTGWEPCDYSQMTYLKRDNDRLRQENEELKTQLTQAIAATEKLHDDKASLLAMMNANM